MIIQATQGIFGEVNLQVGESADVRDELGNQLVSMNAAIEITKEAPTLNKKTK